LANTLLGIVLGGCLGFAGGLARGSIVPGLRAALVGVVPGGVLAACASFALLPVYFRAKERSVEQFSRDLVTPTLVNGGIWMAAGLGAGMAFGFGLGGGRDRVSKAALGGLIGAAAGAVLYEMLSASVFPTSKVTSALPPDWFSRLLARVFVTTLAGLFSAMFLTLSVSRPAKRPGPQ
jgi:hypothetical protein